MNPRLAIGPANYAGQAYAWAQAVTRHTAADAVAFTVDTVRGDPFGFPAHRRIPMAAYYLPVLRTLRARRFLADRTHVILDGFRPLFYDRSPDGFRRQAEALRDRGPTLGLLAHGTDVRDPDAHLARYRHSFFAEGDPGWLAQRRTISARNRETARRLGVPLFVSTPDMLNDLPGAVWVPVCLDPTAWHTDVPPLERRVPRVLFVPSQSVLKGTRHVEPVLRRLAERGLIEYVAPRGVPHAEMVRLVKSVDIVVDQLLFGSYGVAAIEAMAAGRVVVGNISTLGTDVMPELPHVENATPDDFEQVLSSILDRRDEARAAAAGNVGFVRRWHDGREAARRLAPFLGLPATLAR
nr:glycosyltransferase family 4 protein [Propionibacterium sp.]